MIRYRHSPWQNDTIRAWSTRSYVSFGVGRKVGRRGAATVGAVPGA